MDRLEQDTRIIDWSAQLGGWCQMEVASSSDSPRVRSDGVTHTTFGTLSTQEDIAIADGVTNCVGIHIVGPKAGADYTAYQVSASLFCSDNLLIPFLFVAESPASITSSANGDIVSDMRLLAVGESISASGGVLDVDMTFIANENTADRPICIGLGVSCANAASSAEAIVGYLSVRRLIGVDPTVIDTRKL